MTVEADKKQLRSGESSSNGSEAGSTLGASVSTATASPFGTTVDPRSLKGTSYTAASTIIAQSVYAIASKVFSYETAGADDLLDSHLQLWSQQFKRPNSFGIIPFFHKFEVRSGASSAILGYFSKNGTNGQPVSVFAASNTLTYMKPTLALQTAKKLPLSFNVSAIDFDEESNTLTSNYIAPLSEARSLNYPVLTPVSSQDGLELQHLTVLNHYLAFLTGRPSVNLFDGPQFSKAFTKFTNLLSVDALGELYENLLASSKGNVASIDEAVDLAFASLNELTGKSYSQFEYFGSENPESVFVVYGSHESTVVSNSISKLNGKVGLIKVRVPVPFNQNKFVAAIPKSTKKLIILGQVKNSLSQTSSSLKGDITAALFLGGIYHNLIIDEFSYPLDFNWTPVTVSKILLEFLPNVSVDPILKKTIVESASEVTANTSPEGNYLIWGRDDGILVDISNKLALSLSLDDSKTVSIRNKYDNGTNGGLFQSQIVSAKSNSSIDPVDSADVVIIDESVISSYDIVATAKPGAKILLIHQKPINSLEEDVIAKLPIPFKRSLAENQNTLTLIDFSTLEELDAANDSTKGFSGEFLVQVAFWNASFPEVGGFVVNKLLQANGNGFELLGAVLDKFVNSVKEKDCLKEVPVSSEWSTLEEEKKEGEQEEEPVTLALFPSETSFAPNDRADSEVAEETNHGTYIDVATKLAFPEAYAVNKDLRPDLPVKNFVVKVQENKRLTPTEYSRNIFHIEFDISGTGLTYDIGEALGIHSRNNSEEVEKFLKFYNVDGDSIVEVSNKDDTSIYEVRSARQALSDNVDFLGKPPKRFYESLAEFATDEMEKKHLEDLASASGAEELKKRQDVDFCTYVDILEEFKSARPSFAELIKFIAPLKRREYSIASSQRIHPNAVHLLIVVVDWVDTRGRTRFGQCSKYLSDLNINDELVVSVKPSVMKLPPLTTQPIVMSGLGTGLAPFKAFIEEKIWQQQQGNEIGEIYLYMGSRHKKEEYLYGELWEAYKDAGILTHIGAAFSRDQPEKIYIQDKIKESINDLVDAIVVKNGSFYLCGPTWPVPDITACLEDIVSAGAKKTGVPVKDAAKFVEDMKEDGRYILEVY